MMIVAAVIVMGIVCTIAQMDNGKPPVGSVWIFFLELNRPQVKLAKNVCIYPFGMILSHTKIPLKPNDFGSKIRFCPPEDRYTTDYLYFMILLSNLEFFLLLLLLYFDNVIIFGVKNPSNV